MAHVTDESLKAELKNLIGDPTRQRPFVCKGLPSGCKIFIVGLNPATNMKQNFWSFWPGDSFEKDEWQGAYEKARKRQGKTKKSSTRKNLNQITDAFPGECLETNLYWTPTDSEEELKHLIRKRTVTIKPFFALLRMVGPRIVVGHGRQVIAQRDAIEFIVPQVRFIAAERHLRLMSREGIQKLIGQIKRGISGAS